MRRAFAFTTLVAATSLFALSTTTDAYADKSTTTPPAYTMAGKEAEWYNGEKQYQALAGQANETALYQDKQATGDKTLSHHHHNEPKHTSKYDEGYYYQAGPRTFGPSQATYVDPTPPNNENSGWTISLEAVTTNATIRELTVFCAIGGRLYDIQLWYTTTNFTTAIGCRSRRLWASMAPMARAPEP